MKKRIHHINYIPIMNYLTLFGYSATRKEHIIMALSNILFFALAIGGAFIILK